jgi:SseB protein N-terminal domain
MRGLNAAEPQFPGDVGAADPVVAAALTAYAAGQCSEYSALTALARSRLLVPVVAVLTEAQDVPRAGPANAGDETQAGEQTEGAGEADPGQPAGLRQEKSTEMALPTLIGRDGRAAIIAFTSLDALTRWRSDARPVPVPAASVWLAGLQDASAVVIDVAGPVRVAVDGARLAALAAGRPVPMPHQDADVLAALQAVLANEPLIAQAALTTPDQRIADRIELDDAGLAGPDTSGLDITGLDDAAPADVTAATAGDPAEDGAAADNGAVPDAQSTADLALQVTLVHDCDQATAAATGQRIVTALLAATGGRLRRGVEMSVIQPGRR